MNFQVTTPDFKEKFETFELAFAALWKNAKSAINLVPINFLNDFFNLQCDFCRSSYSLNLSEACQVARKVRLLSEDLKLQSFVTTADKNLLKAIEETKKKSSVTLEVVVLLV